jgi:hypothetical protein
MPKNFKFPFPESKQDRSKQTLEDILESAYTIVEAADPDLFTSRVLADKSGYALGTLSRRLSSIENVFLWAVKKGREKHFANFVNILEQFDANLPLRTLVENMTDYSFAAMNKVNPKVIRFYEDRLFKKNGHMPNFYGYVDLLVKPYIECAKRNQTGTFRLISEDEARLIMRASANFTERPFVDGNPIAGTSEHRKIATDNLTRMFGH